VRWAPWLTALLLWPIAFPAAAQSGPAMVVAYDHGHAVITLDAGGAAVLLPVPPTAAAPRLVSTAAIDRLRDQSAPRLVAVADLDPCFPHPRLAPPVRPAPAPVQPATRPGDASVSLFAPTDAAGLQHWIAATGQTLTPDSAAFLAAQRRSGAGFLALRPTPARGWAVQIAYDAPQVPLPVMVRDPGTPSPDLIILTLTRTGGLAPAARLDRVPSGMDLPEYVGSQFPAVYDAILRHHLAQPGGPAILAEFAAPADPSAALPLLGVAWPGLANLTRLHTQFPPPTRVLRPSPALAAFQTSYTTHIAWKGQYTLACAAGFDYRHALTARWQAENATLSALTGWRPADIRAAMVAHWQSTREPSD
jgi:hypothetical protein